MRTPLTPFKWLDAELLDGAGDHAPNLNRLAIFGNDVGVGGVGSFKLDAPEALAQDLHGEVPVHDGHNDVGVARFDGPVHHQNVAIKDAGLGHGVAAGTQKVGGLRVFYEQLGEINPLGAQIFGGRGKAGLYVAANE